jgi:Protein of unknown function (DUF2852)
MHTSDPSTDNPFRCAVNRAWIIPAMVFGYIIWWPIGLALTFYMVFGDRWFREPLDQFKAWHDDHHAGRGTRWTHPGSRAAPTGNHAFDAYRSDVLKRLEDEREQFEAFLARLRQARDKAEFDEFLDDQVRRKSSEQTD